MLLSVCEIVVPVEADAPVMFEFVDGLQLYVTLPIVPVILEVKFIVGAVPEHIVVDDGFDVAEGVGFTVIVNVFETPEQDVAFDNAGFTVIVAVIGEVPELVAENIGISPLPLAANPIEVLLFVHEKFVPVITPLNVIIEVDVLLQ